MTCGGAHSKKRCLFSLYLQFSLLRWHHKPSFHQILLLFLFFSWCWNNHENKGHVIESRFFFFFWEKWDLGISSCETFPLIFLKTLLNYTSHKSKMLTCINNTAHICIYICCHFWPKLPNKNTSTREKPIASCCSLVWTQGNTFNWFTDSAHSRVGFCTRDKWKNTQ